jgi:hypothetical protein
MYQRTLDSMLGDSYALGQFWPTGGDEDQPVEGALRWDENRGAELQILNPNEEWSTRELGGKQDICGLLTDGTLLTLAGTRVSATRESAMFSATLRTNTMLLGADCEPTTQWSEMTFRTSHLHRWRPLTGLSTPTRETSRLAVEWRQPESLRIELDEGEIEFGSILQSEMNRGPDQSLRTNLNVHVRPAGEMSLEALERTFVRPLQALSAVAADRWDDVSLEVVVGPEIEYPVSVLRAGRTAPAREWDHRDGDYLFQASDCDDVIAFVQRWFRLFATAGLPIAVFGETLRSANSYSPGRLIALVTALEGYCDAVLSRGKSFLATFKVLRDHAGVDPQANRCTDENLELLWRARNYFTHLGAHGKYTPQELEEALLNCCRWATSLMQSCLLRDLGFATEKIEALLGAHYQRWPLP